MGKAGKIVWPNVFVFALYHLLGIQGLYYLLTLQTDIKTFIWIFVLALISGEGITAGVHRFWSHKAFKANLPLQLFLCLGQTIAFQNDIFEWARDHRLHHSFADTDADPHDSTKGFFFCHMGWLLCRKHPEVIAKGQGIDVSDLEADPLVMFQRKYYYILAPLFSFVIPTVVPWYFWGEDLYVSVCAAAMFRYIFTLHFTWFINSAGHMWGYKPYDIHIRPVESPTLAYMTLGEGWHNYHHAFPQDYKGSELGLTTDNVTTAFILLMAKIGWAYDLRTVSPERILRRIKKTGAQSEASVLQKLDQESSPHLVKA